MNRDRHSVHFLYSLVVLTIGILSWRTHHETTTTIGSKLRSTPPHPSPYCNGSSSPKQQTNVTIIIQLSGELGNHLSKLSAGVALSWILTEQFHDVTNTPPIVLVQHQAHTTKWQGAVQTLNDCFGNVGPLNVSEGEAYDIEALKRKQQQQQQQHSINDPSLDNVQLALYERLCGNQNDKDDNNELVLYSDYLVGLDDFTNVFYDAYRQLFTIDCTSDSKRPYRDEVVVYIRGFLHEMPRKGLQKGYRELSPYELLDILPTHSKKKVALLGRFPNTVLQPYQDLLQDFGWTVRIIASTSVVDDFVFLQHAFYSIGSVRSTFYFWSRLLGDGHAVLYSIRHAAYNPHPQQWNFTHPELLRRFEWPIYDLE